MSKEGDWERDFSRVPRRTPSIPLSLIISATRPTSARAVSFGAGGWSNDSWVASGSIRSYIEPLCRGIKSTLYCFAFLNGSKGQSPSEVFSECLSLPS